MSILSKDLGIDLGTANVVVYAEGKGIVLREPSVVAVDKNTGKILKVGSAARNMLGRTPGNVVAMRPLREGVVSDYELTERMLAEFFRQIFKYSFVKPRVVISVPSGITSIEERAVVQIALEAGARRVYLIEEPLAAALGANLSFEGPDGHMVVDIGGGTTDVGVLTLNGLANSASIKVAGGSFDEAIVKYVRRKHNLLIGLGTAEEVKRSIGCVIQRPDVGLEEVKGRSLTNGLPKTVQLSSTELIEAFVEPMNRILESIHTVLERTPPQLVGDLDRNGIVMSGGGSLIYGIDRLIERSTGIRTIVVDDPVSCAAYGAGKMLKHLDDMQDGMMNFYRKRQMKA